ncbi:hypothetical protein CK203_100992 [Vitis vinifera]|uniref:Uncharacterized protein n=1 Tax=Vitis vinifera TaxID=29760 RepID=A0A438DFT9_VITVI|nr:hypothetical protein CK203_100992 [Vitis vinifera]
MEDGDSAAESGIMDQRPKSEDAEGLVGSAAVEDAGGHGRTTESRGRSFRRSTSAEESSFTISAMPLRPIPFLICRKFSVAWFSLSAFTSYSMGCLEVSICFTVGPLGSEYFCFCSGTYYEGRIRLKAGICWQKQVTHYLLPLLEQSSIRMSWLMLIFCKVPYFMRMLFEDTEAIEAIKSDHVAARNKNAENIMKPLETKPKPPKLKPAVHRGQIIVLSTFGHYDLQYGPKS